MKTTVGMCIALVGLVTLAADDAQAQQGSGANAIMPWAYTLNAPADPNAAPPNPDEVVRVPNSDVTFRRSELRDLFNPPDWHPDNHPAPPPIVRNGRSPDVRACGYCHLPNGQGRPENASVAGQPEEYIIQQMRDYRNGLRKSSEPDMGPPRAMVALGAAATEEESREAAAYFSSFPFRKWIRVVETETVPETVVRGWMAVPVDGGGREPIGTRIIETPEDPVRTALRDSEASFIAYVPTGSVARGRALADAGSCAMCHGEGLKGLGPLPALAGRSPSYVARQLYDFQQGNRNGAYSDLMDATVADLSIEDIVNLAAYTASLDP